MPEHSPYGVTQNADADLATANSMVGTLVGSTIGNALVGNAALFSTAPYIPPPSPDIKGCHGKNGQCRAPRAFGTRWCIFHMPKDDGEPPAAT